MKKIFWRFSICTAYVCTLNSGSTSGQKLCGLFPFFEANVTPGESKIVVWIKLFEQRRSAFSIFLLSKFDRMLRSKTMRVKIGHFLCTVPYRSHDEDNHAAKIARRRSREIFRGHLKSVMTIFYKK